MEPLDAALYTNSMAESGARAPEGLPDGLVATAKGDTTKGDIRAAWYVGPTRRYGHGILGDAIEAAALRVELVDGAQLTYDLPQNMVFEDRTPRIADLDGDGRNEVITIRSSTSEGGGVAIYAAVEGRLTEVAANDFIGLRNRWLNIAAIADITGDGRKDIAYVRTPHIGGMLRLFRYDDGLTLTSEIDRFSNHAIGSREQRLSAWRILTVIGIWRLPSLRTAALLCASSTTAMGWLRLPLSACRPASKDPYWPKDQAPRRGLLFASGMVRSSPFQGKPHAPVLTYGMAPPNLFGRPHALRCPSQRLSLISI